MLTILDDISAQLPDVVAIATPPVGDLGWGSDLSCTDDLDPTMSEILGSDPLAVAQANYRRLRTTPGELLDDPDYGKDIDAYIQQGMTAAALQRIPAEVTAELQQDDRNNNVRANLTKTTDGAYRLDVSADSVVGPYSLTLALTDAGALLDAIHGTK